MKSEVGSVRGHCCSWRGHMEGMSWKRAGFQTKQQALNSAKSLAALGNRPTPEPPERKRSLPTSERLHRGPDCRVPCPDF